MTTRFFLIVILLSAVASCASSDKALIIRTDRDIKFAVENDQEAEFEEVHTDLVHSDLPSFGALEENVWPQHFIDEDSFGCASTVAFGDWRLDERNSVEPVWYRFEYSGVMHCWALVGEAFEQEEIEHAHFRPAFFVFLDEADSDSNMPELWAIQLGARPGSDYMLLSRSPSEEPIEEFDVLQTRCPEASMREGPNLDILITRYCALNSQTELLQFAREMLQLPPIGRLARLPDAEQDD